jgi:hypothetical protein
MTADDWQKIEGVYLDASALNPADRAAYLDRACGGDPELRAEVESLLEADRKRGRFLELPPSLLAADCWPAIPPRFRRAYESASMRSNLSSASAAWAKCI